MQSDTLYRHLQVALVIPCYNEAGTIGAVIDGFRSAMPGISITVFDNGSLDNTADIARAKGVDVIHVAVKGKGNVVRRMFADIDADAYVMVDGDSTYDPASMKSMIDKLIDEKLDMVVGCRQTDSATIKNAYRRGHQWGNRILTESVCRIFGGSFMDMLSGYRVFSRRFVKSFPVLSDGFGIETELTIHALELKMPVGEIITPYGARPEGSVSKLSTYRDGWKILMTILRLYMLERPLQFYGLVGAVLALSSIGLSLPILIEFLNSGLVPRLPTAVLCASMMLLAAMSLQCGMILDSVARGRKETKRLFYLFAQNK